MSKVNSCSLTDYPGGWVWKQTGHRRCYSDSVLSLLELRTAVIYPHWPCMHWYLLYTKFLISKKGEVSVLKELVVYDGTHINKQSPMYCNECSNKNMHKWQWQHRVIFLHEVEEISEIIEDNVETVQNSALFQQNSAESAFQRRIRMCKDRGTCHLWSMCRKLEAL